MIAAASAAGVAKHENALQVVHERSRLGKVGGWRAVFDGEAFAFADDAPGAARHLGDHICAEALYDLVERPRNGW